MKKNVWKVRVIEGYDIEFKQLCKERNIFCKSYPEPIIRTYRVECPKDTLLDIGYCIATLEEMPVVTLS